MSWKINSDHWMPWGMYVRYVIYTLTHKVEPSIYERHFPRTEWQRRWGRVKTTDGLIHTLWCHWSRVRYNWFTIGYHCWRHGHDYDKQFITWAPERKIEPVPDRPGHSRFANTGKTENHYITACRYCGHYRGHSKSLRT